MTSLKYWDGSAWQTVTAVQGPQGPQGVAGPTGAGGLLDVRKQISAGNAYKAFVSGNFHMDAAGAVPVRLDYTPPVNAWWEVDFHMGIMQKVDSAYHYIQPSVSLNVADVDGVGGFGITRTQHGQVNTYEPYTIRALFKLAAGTAYYAFASGGFSGGTWQYFQASNNLQLSAKAWAR